MSQHLHVQVLARLDEASQEQPPVKFLVAVMSACCTTLVRASEVPLRLTHPKLAGLLPVSALLAALGAPESFQLKEVTPSRSCCDCAMWLC